MIIENNKVVTLTCTFREQDQNGAIIDSFTENNPLSILIGYGNMFESFEQQLMNKKVGDSFEFILSPADAFGEYNEDDVILLPFSVFGELREENQKLDIEVGQVLRFVDKNENELLGKVLNIDYLQEQVTVDFNHPLAGIPIHFSGKILEIRDATQSEIDHGHVH